MDKWVYRTMYIEWKELKDSRGKKYNAWVVEFSDGSRVEGLDAILNREGNAGWELVTVSEWGGATTTRFLAFFKRKVQEATS